MMDAINDSGDLFLTHTVAPAPDDDGRLVGEPRVALRMAIGATRTQEGHVRSAWDRFQHLAESMA
jgi:aromatic-L-amino-acid decarboxylase